MPGEEICALYVHDGKEFPEHVFLSIYQTFRICEHYNNSNIKVYFLTNAEFRQKVCDTINSMNLQDKTKRNFLFYSIENLRKDQKFLEFLSAKSNLHQEIQDFRQGFWIHTSSRFMYIDSFIKNHNLKNVFHIENDVMIYEDLNKIYRNLKQLNMNTKIVAVQDAPDRAVCSLVFIPDKTSINNYTDFMLKTVKKNPSLDDMNIMGSYSDKFHFPDSPSTINSEHLGIYDGACIGQYLGGTDIKNDRINKQKHPFDNPNRGFINETAVFKPNTVDFLSAKINSNTSYSGKKYYIKSQQKMFDLNVIHVHSKYLYEFSSDFNLDFTDLISGNRVISKCDFLICQNNHLTYDKHLLKHISPEKVILVKDFDNINFLGLNDILSSDNKTDIKICLFNDYIKDKFVDIILPQLDKTKSYSIYIHNGDDHFSYKNKKLLDYDCIKRVYTQNPLMYPEKKLTILPIGISRDIFPYGDLVELYKTIVSTYYKKKQRGLYININPKTYSYRKILLEVIIRSRNFTVNIPNKKYNEYLQELSEYRFCLCVRGNGLDTYRFWESLYLGVIPVVIDNGTYSGFLKHLDTINIPYLTINSLEFFKTHDDNYFSQELYDKTLNDKNITSLQSIEALKIKNYFN